MEQANIEQALTELTTIQDFIRWIASQFNQSAIYYGHGTNNAIDESLQLVLPSLGLPLTIPAEFFNAKLTHSEKQLLAERVLLRINERVPTPYLTNKVWFCEHEFYVDERVLIPRSPIGELIDNHFCYPDKESGQSINPFKQTPERILDLCTGSGCIGIACAYAYPDAEVDLVDISSDALAVAEINIESHQLQHRVMPICSDLFEDIPEETYYDLIVTNPPYVDQEDMQDLPIEYTLEPELALAAGIDGLDIVKQILQDAPNYLTDDGILVCEVGNSWVALALQYPNIPFTWLTFKRGGEGIFLLTKAQLLAIADQL